ncbi:hypothetical protein OG992_18715 [Micromonospora sp. NBC_00362]|uniref:hypothetical protein n=1 Tax=Micromonospora sp. NBC_00362 TaxID=2975975 RepID=UPI002256D584|nr:hypothetical protein [Micromonospora sp. NBC_00362]MCX5119222.1 hypothetical protein [Micromonospora sp. NBC_00362]
MADTSTTEATETAADDTTTTAKAETGGEKPQDVPPEVKQALRKANKEAESLRLKLKEYEDRDKTEAEKLAERAATAERERDAAKAAELRLRIAAKHGISDEHADLFLNGTDEATLTKQAEQLVQLAESSKKRSNHVPREGTSPTSGSSSEREFTRSLFGTGD